MRVGSFAHLTAVRHQREPAAARATAVFVVGLVAVLTLPGCALHKVETKRELPVALGEAFDSGDADVAARWWRSFEDPTLNKLVDQALTTNLDLRRGWLRLAQFDSIASQVGAAALPQVQGSADAQYSQRAIPIATQVITTTAWQFPLAVSASYELDLWGRLAAMRGGAAADVAATREDLNALAIGLVARISETWLSTVELRAQSALLQQQLDVSKRLLGVVEGRFAQGLVSAVDVLQQRQHLAGVTAQDALLQGNLHVLNNQLRALLGQAPNTPIDVGERAELPELAALPKVGLPGSILEQRPDVRAARLRVLAADHRVGQALAERLPTLRLSAQAGVTGVINKGGASINPAWSAAAGIAGPIFDGGRLKAEHDRTKSALADQVLAWGQVVITALHEIDDALARERAQRTHLKLLDGQLEVATKAFVQAQNRYAAGVADFLPVLTSLQAVQQLERNRLSASRQLISHRVSLYRALGGSWAVKPGPERPKRPAAANKGGGNDGA